MADAFKHGDIVRLKSGGPKMTLVEYGVWGLGEEERKAKCRWFDTKNQHPLEAVFFDHELELASDSGGGSGLPVRPAPRGPGSWMS